MDWLIAKALSTALLVALVSETARCYADPGGLIAALAVMMLLVLIWLHIEKQPIERVANHAWSRSGAYCQPSDVPRLAMAQRDVLRVSLVSAG